MNLKNMIENSKQTSRAQRRYYDDLERRMLPADRAIETANLDRGLLVVVAVPVVSLAGAATGYLWGGPLGAALVWMTTLLGLQFDLLRLGMRWARSMREYHEDRGGRMPRSWNKKERAMVGPIVSGGAQPRKLVRQATTEVLAAEP